MKKKSQIPILWGSPIANMAQDALASLNPSEILVLLLKAYAPLEDLMKFTFIDLLLKKVLTIKPIEKPAHSRDPHIRKYLYIETGLSFETYSASPFEKKFLLPLEKSKGKAILLKRYISSVDKLLVSPAYANALIKREPKMRSYFLFSLPPWMARVTYNPYMEFKGNDLREALHNYIYNFSSSIFELFVTDTEKAIKTTFQLGGNLALVNDFNYDFIHYDDCIVYKEGIDNKSHDGAIDFEFFLQFFQNDSVYDEYINQFVRFYELIIEMEKPGPSELEVDLSDWF